MEEINNVSKNAWILVRKPHSDRLLTMLIAKLRNQLLNIFILLLVIACDTAVQQANSPNSILITNALLIDGTGASAQSGDIRIEGELIINLGDLEPIPGETMIDAGGLVLSPGFIDTHSHHDRGLAENRDALPLLSQGITTAVFGLDGSHQYPLSDFFAAYESEPASINIASYAGHNTLREHFMTNPFSPQPSDLELQRMLDALQSELASGALGLSSGLEYEPGMYSELEELVILAQISADAGGRYSSHIRSEDRTVYEAIDELLEIGRQTGIPIHYSHMKLAGQAFWNEAANVKRILNEARVEGVLITGDIYPYLYWGSTIFVLFPDRNPDNLAEIEFVLDQLAPADGIIFTRFEPNPGYVGLSIADIARLRETSEVLTMSHLMKEANAWSDANGGQSAEAIMGRSMQEADIAELMKWEFANITSDGGFTGHPRGRGAFTRILARYVRELNVLSLEEAIRKMTSLAAQSLGLDDRGMLMPGMKADMVLFNPDTVQDHATIDEPQLLSSGIEIVWVNGQIVYDNGATTGNRSGQVIRRAENPR